MPIQQNYRFIMPMVAALSIPCAAQTPNQNPRAASPMSRGLLISTDFNSPAWPNASNAGTSKGVATRISRQNLGTIDSYQGTMSGALELSADFSTAKNAVQAKISSGVLKWKNRETNLAKITLGFDLWQGEVHPIRVVIASLDTKGKTTGSRAATLTGPVAGAWHRFTLDWDKTSAVSGKFDAIAPQISLSFELRDEDGAVSRAPQILRVDNVSVSVPALYVSGQGSDQNDGATERNALATIQKAVDLAVPGDVICLMDGLYTSKNVEDIVRYTKNGSPARWITLRANPGAKPELRPTGWNAIRVNDAGSYLEIRDLIVRGHRRELTLEDATADGALKVKNEKNYPGDPKFNGNGISIQSTSNSETARPHHIRILNNLVVDNPGGGISAIGCDYVDIENNICRDNCHFMRYGGSGISVFRSWNFDGFKGHKMFVVGNVASGNRTFVPWAAIGKISDGNGIIIDDNINSQSGASQVPYEGRTLVQNNLSFGNGGSGIHAYASRFVDIVNNTAYLNAQSPELVWRQIFAGGKCDDIRIVNNIFYAPKGKPLDLSTEKSSHNIVYANNLFFGEGENAVKSGGGLGAGAGSTAPGATTAGDLGTNAQADPKFVKPSLDPQIADFRLAPGSPGLGAASPIHPGAPRTDLLGKRRPFGKASDLGAYQMTSPTLQQRF